MPETPEQYRSRLINYSEGRDPLKLQAGTPRRIELALKHLPAAKLRKRPAPGTWSIAEIVAHLADSELVRGFRIRMILGAAGTPIQAFDQDKWATALHYAGRDVRKSLEQFRTLREANLALLRSLSPKQLKRYGVHSDRGRETIETMVRMSAGHDINHLRQIQCILASEKVLKHRQKYRDRRRCS